MRISRPYLCLCVLAAGCASLGVEISAAHLLRVVYGTSNIVWASVIGLMLLFLAIGYRMGGIWADRPPGAQTASFLRLLVWAGFTAGAAAILTRLLLRPAAAALAVLNIGPVVGSFVAALALLAVPVILLGCVAPYAVRLALGPSPGTQAAGSVTGQVYAASTLGSFLGTFLPTFFLIPLAGARITYWALAGLLLVVAISGLTRSGNQGRAQVSRQASLLFIVFVVGMVLLGAQVTANRLLGPAFGDSNLVWAAVIGVNMASLSIGYFVGGRLADRTPDPRALSALLVAAALTTALIPLIADSALAVANELAPDTPAGFFLAVTAATAIMFSLPAVLMGCASPFAIRLLLPRAQTAGRTAGTLYAVSAIGSLAGAVIPVLWLIPAVGAAGALLILALALSTVAVAGILWRGKRRDWTTVALPVILLVAAPLSQGPLKAAPGQVFETESAYNYIQVVERDGVYYLFLNEGQGIHSIHDPSGELTKGTWDFFLAAPFFNPSPYRPADVNSVALVGLAAGTISKQCTNAFGAIPIDGIEIDAKIVAVGRGYFAMAEPNLNVIIGDGRYELKRQQRHYDLIGIDAFRLPYIPWHLTTQEFFEEVRSRLTGEGVVAINVGRTPADRSLVEAMTATLGSVFPTVHVMDVPGTFNTILVATMLPTTAASLGQNLALMGPDTSPMLREATEYALAAIRPTVESDIVFTDDRAPVEMMTNRVVIGFLLSGGTQTLGDPIGE